MACFYHLLCIFFNMKESMHVQSECSFGFKFARVTRLSEMNQMVLLSLRTTCHAGTQPFRKINCVTQCRTSSHKRFAWLFSLSGTTFWTMSG